MPEKLNPNHRISFMFYDIEDCTEIDSTNSCSVTLKANATINHRRRHEMCDELNERNVKIKLKKSERKKKCETFESWRKTKI